MARFSKFAVRRWEETRIASIAECRTIQDQHSVETAPLAGFPRISALINRCCAIDAMNKSVLSEQKVLEENGMEQHGMEQIYLGSTRILTCLRNHALENENG